MYLSLDTLKSKVTYLTKEEIDEMVADIRHGELKDNQKHIKKGIDTILCKDSGRSIHNVFTNVSCDVFKMNLFDLG